MWEHKKYLGLMLIENMTMHRGLLDISPHEQAISLVYYIIDLVATSMHLRSYNTIIII